MDTDKLRTLLKQMHPESLRSQALALLGPEPTLPENVRREGLGLFFTDNTTGVPWLARLREPGDPYGYGLLAASHLVEFWDQRTPEGQFVSRYYAKTLKNSTGGLILDGGFKEWDLDSRSMDLVRFYLLPKP